MPTVRQFLVYASLSALAVAEPSFAQGVVLVAATNYRVSGTVIDRGGQSVENAEVALVYDGAIRQSTVTDVDGRFNLGEFPAASATLQVRRIGYEQINKKITIGANAAPTLLEVVLNELPQKLEEVLVKADETGRLRDFTAHKNERNNFGRYFDRSEIRKRNPSFASELLRTVPGAQVQSSAFGGNTVRIRGCKPLVWMDGQRVPGAELDDVARPSDIAGIEIYSSNAGIPAEYMDRNNGACGIIVVWSKSQ